VFAGWVLVAPLFQLAARANPIGYWANTALYLAPPILFALWTVTPRRGRQRAARLVDVFPLAYLLLALGSLMFSKWAVQTGYKPAVDQLYQYTGIGVIGYYFCAFGPVRARLPRYFASAFVVSGFIIGSLAVIEFLTHWTLWGNEQPAGQEFRAVATLSGSGVLGAFLGAAIALATAILLWDGPRSLRLPSIATLAVTVPGIFFTLTRGPILAALIVVAAMIAVRRSGVRWIWAGVAILTAVAIVMSWGAISSTSVYKNRVTQRSNVEGRLLIDSWSIKLFERRPITGYGYGSFDAVKNAAQLSPGNLPLASGIDYTSHNTFLTILVELGALGLLLLAFPWLKVTYEALRGVMSRSVPDPWLVVGCAGMVGTYVLTGLSTDMRFFSIVPALAWIAVGMMRGQLLLGSERREEAAPR
jgi:O-antigen ligase